MVMGDLRKLTEAPWQISVDLKSTLIIPSPITLHLRTDSSIYPLTLRIKPRLLLPVMVRRGIFARLRILLDAGTTSSLSKWVNSISQENNSNIPSRSKPARIPSPSPMMSLASWLLTDWSSMIFSSMVFWQIIR